MWEDCAVSSHGSLILGALLRAESALTLEELDQKTRKHLC